MRRPRSAHVLALDLSLKATGIAVVPERWGLDWRRVHVAKVGYALRQDASELERFERIDSIQQIILGLADRFSCRVAVIEQHAFSKGGGAHALERAELVGVVKHQLFAAGLQVEVYNASAARALLGRAPRKDAKDWAHAQLLRAGAPLSWTGDQLDAFLQANQYLSLTGGDALMLER